MRCMDAAEIAAVANAVTPFIAGAASAYGAGVLEKVQDEAVEVTVAEGHRLGVRLLTRLLRRGEHQDGLAAAVEDAAEDPQDEDRRAALRVQLRKALAADPRLAEEIRKMLPPDATARVVVQTFGERSIAAQKIGIASTGTVHLVGEPDTHDDHGAGSDEELQGVRRRSGHGDDLPDAVRETGDRVRPADG